jgi:proteasome accessory factor B
MSKTERLINLVAMLLAARRPVTLERIRQAIPDYKQENPASFKRMFERDKKELREMGVPIEVEPLDPFGEEQGYRIPREGYYLPEIDFTPEEKAALFLVSQAVASEGLPLSPEVESAFLKLSPDFGDGVLLQPGSYPMYFVGSSSTREDLHRLWDAVLRRKRVRFSYQSMNREAPETREVDPYGLFYRHGCWYLVGHCHLRGEIRCFRLDRIRSEVEPAYPGSAAPDFERPPGFRLEDYSRKFPWEFEEGERAYHARVLFSPKVAWMVERDLGDRYTFEPGDDGGGVLHLEVRNEEGMIHWLMGFGEDAVVLSPPELREKVIRRLEEMLYRLEGGRRP